MKAPSISDFCQKHQGLKGFICQVMKKMIAQTAKSLGQTATDQQLTECVNMINAKYASKMSLRALFHCLYLVRIYDQLFGDEKLYFAPSRLAKWIGTYWTELSKRKMQHEQRQHEMRKEEGTMNEEVLDNLSQLGKRLAVK